MDWSICDSLSFMGERQCKITGAHGEVYRIGSSEAAKVMHRYSGDDLPYEFAMELISRDRLDGMSSDVSRVVPILGVIETPKYYAMRMPLVENDLWSVIYDDKLRGMCRSITRDTMQALHSLHCRGVAHRDVKDANVLVDTGSGRAFLCDMSIATCAPHWTRDTFVPYTGHYRAPEVCKFEFNGNLEVDWYKADVYAMGALLGRMALACKFDGPASEFPRAPPSRWELDRDPVQFFGKDVAMRMMDDDPEARPSIAEAMRMLGFKPIDPPPPHPPELLPPQKDDMRIRRYCKSRRMPGWVADVACDLMYALPREIDRTGTVCSACIAMALKMCAPNIDYAEEGCSRQTLQEIRRLVPICLRDPTIRIALHDQLRT